MVFFLFLPALRPRCAWGSNRLGNGGTGEGHQAKGKGVLLKLLRLSRGLIGESGGTLREISDEFQL